MVNENRSFWKLLLLTIPTLGIYNIVFWYKATKDLNDMNPNKKKLPNYILVIFLTIITLGIYHWVWFYWFCDRTQIVGEKFKMEVRPTAGIQLFLRTFGTFFILGPFISSFLAIRNLNKVAAKYNKYIQQRSKVVNPQA